MDYYCMYAIIGKMKFRRTFGQGSQSRVGVEFHGTSLRSIESADFFNPLG